MLISCNSADINKIEYFQEEYDNAFALWLSGDKQGAHDLAVNLAIKYPGSDESSFMVYVFKSGMAQDSYGEILNKDLLSEASPYLERAVNLEPDDLRYRSHYAKLLFDIGAHEESLLQFKALFDRAQSINDLETELIPFVVGAYSGLMKKLGYSRELKDRLAKWMAETDYHEAVFVEYMEMVAFEDFNAAKKMVDEYKSKRGYSEVVLEGLCFAAYELKMRDDALRCYREIVNNPLSSDIFIRDAKSRIYYLEEKKEKNSGRTTMSY